MTINALEYQKEHGALPRGEGEWTFIASTNSGRETRVYRVKGKYGEAAKVAEIKAYRDGYTGKIVVVP
jgi:hypothetical protein